MIIGVAVKSGDLCIALPKPHRHADCIKIILSLGLKDGNAEWGKSKNQGFYDEHGKFYNRDEAAEHAFRIGQVQRKNCFNSEDFW